jgi:murein DD-endopeptidase MepM/ murein hydrolase activator NlpD
MRGSLDPAGWVRAAFTGLLVAVALAAVPAASNAAATASITLNKTEFRAGDTLIVGFQITNSSDSPPANLYVGVVMPDGETALFLVPGGATAPVSLFDPANFRSLQAAPAGFTLNAAAFSQFTWPADGLPIGTYQVFVALTEAGNGSVLALDVKPFTYSPRNVFLPIFRKPFDGEMVLSNWFDHNLPFEFVDMNGFTVNFTGETSPFGIDGHNGYDFRMAEGTPLLAAATGIVTFAGAETPFACPVLGNQLVSGLGVNVRHTAPNGQLIDSSYAHMSRIDVTTGQQVVAGQQLGLSGNTGCTTAPHLHFNTFRLSGTNNGQRTRIDPFGWDSPQTDPWAQHPQGAQSFYLWLPGQAPALRYRPVTLAPNCGTPPTCGNAAVTITQATHMGVRDDLNPNNEFVELTLDTRFNSGNTTRVLTGYRLENRAGETYPLPAGFVIREGQPVRVYSGHGVNGERVLFWGRNTEAWNNFLECVQLVTPGGGRYRIGIGGGCP